MKKIFLSISLLCAASLLINAQQQKGGRRPENRSGQQKAAAKPEAPAKFSFREIGDILPPLRIVDTGKHVYTEQDFKNNNHFFLFMFNPTCGHCQQMARLVGENAGLFKNNKIAFMAGPAVMEYMNSFYQSSSIGLHPEIKVGVDSASAVDQLYNYKMLPQINIYDKDRKLVKVLYGDVPLDSLKQYVP